MKITFNSGIKMLLIPIACLLFITTKANAQRQDFSGTWKINKEKSDFGELSPNSAAVEIKVVQEGKQIAITRHQVFASGEILNSSERMSFDGRPSETNLNNELMKTSSVKWSDDNKFFSEESHYSDNRQAKEVWALSDGGNVLTIHRVSSDEDGNNEIIYVYDKQ